MQANTWTKQTKNIGKAYTYKTTNAKPAKWKSLKCQKKKKPRTKKTIERKENIKEKNRYTLTDVVTQSVQCF